MTEGDCDRARTIRDYRAGRQISSVGCVSAEPRRCSARTQSPTTRLHVRQFTATATNQKSEEIPHTPFPIFRTVADFREWRDDVRQAGLRVGFVPTMGALHEGHLDLVKHSLRETDVTVVSVFVNPAQFAPTEDLSSYPRTMASDMAALSSLQAGRGRIGAIFAPTVVEMYPSPDGKPFTQHVKEQVGAFVEVAGLQHKMEGASRPTFFRGVATVVTKLFHVVQPHLAFFGQKDIQQAMLLRRMVSDLLFAFPPNANAVRVIPTVRDQHDGLALSSRNAYLTHKARPYANVLFRALSAGKRVWQDRPGDVKATLDEARSVAQQVAEEAAKQGIKLELLYIDLNDPITLDNLETADRIHQSDAIFSGAALIRDGPDGRTTRLIDNVLLGFSL